MALSECLSTVNEQGRELLDHGTALFPLACYHDDLERMRVPWHWHDEVETTIVEGGAAIIAAGGERQLVKPEDGFLINTRVLHGMWPAGPGKCCLRAVLFHPRLVGGSMDSIFYQKYLQPLLSDAGRQFLIFHQDVPWEREVLQWIQAAWQACAEEPRGYEFQVRHALSQEVLLLSEHCTAAPQDPSPKALRNDQRIKAMLQYIQENLCEELSTRSIARSANLSESECLRCFRAMVGTTPIQYVKQLRLHRSAELLLSDPSLSVAEAAARCGFQDASYFTKTFREARGCTPSEYRSRCLPRP